MLEPQTYDAVESLKRSLSQGIRQRIATACTHRLSFTQSPLGILVPAPDPARGLLGGLMAGSAGEFVNRWAAILYSKLFLVILLPGQGFGTSMQPPDPASGLLGGFCWGARLWT